MTRPLTLTATARPHSLRTAVFASRDGIVAEAEGAEKAYEDLKMFATGWLGGLVFFGTFLA